jgi:hypothetical protein
VKRHRLLTVAGGSAIAAVLALSVFFFPGTQSRVEAATIFAEFRQALTRGFMVTARDVGSDGIKVDARLFVQFDPATAAATNFRQPEGAYLEAQVRSESMDSPEAISADLELSLIPENEWAYVKLNRLPRSAIDEEPFLLMVHAMASQGLFVDLKGLTEELSSAEGLSKADLSFSTGISADGDVPGGPKFKFSTRFHDTAAGAEDKDDPDASEADQHEGIEEQVVVNAWTSGTPPVMDHAGADADADNAMLGDVDVTQVQGVIKSMFKGEAGGAELDSVVELIRQAAGQVDVVEQRPGHWLLTASQFRAEMVGDAEDAALIEKLVLKVAYEEGRGVPWALLENVGDYNGTIRFETSDQPIDPALTDKAKYLNGKTRVFDLSKWIQRSGGSSKESSE